MLSSKVNEQTLNIAFVGLVEKYPILYNYKLPGYSRKDLTEKAWCEVGKQVHMTVSECKEKWKNLRAVFVRNIKLAPCGSGSKKKKPYYLAEAMQFAQPFVKALTMASPGNQPDISHQEREVFDAIEIEDNFSQQINASSQPPPQTPPTSKSVTPLQSDTLFEHDPQPIFIRKGGSNIDQVDKFNHYFDAKRAKIVTTPCQNSCQSEKREAMKMFLLSLLPELEEMSSQQIKLFKRKTFVMIDEIMSQTQMTPISTQPTFCPSPVLSSSSQPCSDDTNLTSPDVEP